jgi:hypothetical protein
MYYLGGKVLNDLHNLVINVAIGGCIGENVGYHILEEQVDKVFHEAVACAQEYNNADYRFSGADVKVNLLSNPYISDTFWINFADKVNMPLNAIIPYDADDNSFHMLLNKAHSVTNINANRNYSAGSGSVMVDWIADQVDLSVFLWDGREDFNNQEIWNLIQACKRSNIPSIWIDINSPENIYWILDSYFERFTSEKLQAYIKKLFCKSSSAFDPPGKSKIPFWRLWNFLYDRFMKKYKAKILPVTYIDDKVMDNDHIAYASGETREPARQKIISWFTHFDNNAIAYSQKYRTSIYLRSIMPFIATIFISIGFYTEAVLGFIKFPAVRINPWSILAGVGFLIHGLINYYMYNLSENKNVAGWHLRFIDNRFIAEVLRLTAHFAPFGIPVNYKSSLNRFGNKISKNPHVSNELRRIIRSIGMANATFDRFSANDLLENLIHMIDDQSVYHDQANKRYIAIVSKLKKYVAVFFAIGLTIVVLRGGLQFVLVYFPADNQKVKDHISLIKSFANMLALVFPAWASYFSLKISLSNFEGLANNSNDMKDSLTLMKKIIMDEKKKPDISFERIYTFSKDLSGLMLGEVVEWYSQISTQKFTKL